MSCKIIIQSSQGIRQLIFVSDIVRAAHSGVNSKLINFAKQSTTKDSS